MEKHQHDRQINHQQSNLIWRYNSLVCWNIQTAFPALNHWCGFKAWLDSRDLKISLWWSALQHAPLLKISEPPRVVLLLTCRIFRSHRGQMVHTQVLLNLQRQDVLVLIPLCTKRLGKSVLFLAHLQQHGLNFHCLVTGLISDNDIIMTRRISAIWVDSYFALGEVREGTSFRQSRF